MSDQKDLGIKLFGRAIPVAPEPSLRNTEAEEPPRPEQPPEELQPPAPEEEATAEDQHNGGKEEKEDSEMKVDAPQEEKGNEMKVDAPEEKKEKEMKGDVPQEKEDEEMKVDAPQMPENVEPDSSSTLDHKKEDQGQMNSPEDKAASDPKGENEKTANDESGQDKALKKPDKILPCPRCNSMDTKFCYYNNYNVNQPRHFCKNCQRYWTAGGTMRNVPVGAGRRKSKNSSLHYRQLLMAPDCMMGSRVDISKCTVLPEALVPSPSALIQPTSSNETVLKFGPEVPLCESMVSALNIDEQNVTNAGSAPRGENREDNPCASSVTLYNGLPENAVHVDKNGAPVYCNGVTPMPQYYLGAPFMYPWSVGWNNLPVMVPGSMPESVSPSEGCSTSPAPWMNSPMMPPSRLPGPAFPYPLVPPALWGCLSGWPATMWNIPWVRPNGCVSPSSSSNSSCSGNGSPTLGKHSRDSNPLKEEKEKSLWVPKTLRIDDPDEAAKSSIWTTLGIKPGDPGTFKPFRSKVESKGQTSDGAQVLQANPAALSRSQSFQESS